ncbi:MAG: TIGR01841 family phasin [Rhodospirillales bacterium]|jgi:phasin family protein|nr:TIGR01841 family phasin [Rhodospirillales bacterium]
MYADFMKMAEKSNPFFADYAKMMTEFDPKKMADEFTKATKGFEMPKFDFDAVIELQKKNFDALSAANHVAAEGAQAFAKRQSEMLQQALEEVSKMIETFTKIENPQAVAAVQADLLKGAFVKSVDNTRELADLLTKSNAEASDALNTRVVEALEEVKKTVLKAAKKK